MSLTPQFSDALTSHFATSSDSGRVTDSTPVSPSPVPFTRKPSESADSQRDTGTPTGDRRRGNAAGRVSRAGMERRQFGSSHSGLSADGRDLASAIDAYKLEHRRRYITCDEMLVVLTSLGYEKAPAKSE